jgi:membrane associated rhomboid family serine protease
VIGSYLALHPRADIRIPVPFGPLLVPLARQPAWVGWMFAAAWAGNEVFTALTAGAFAGGVNHLAHLAGFAAGILLVALHESANIIFVALYLFPTAWPLLREFLINRWGT